MINNVILVGRTTKNLELKQNSNGNSYVRFTLACNRSFKNENGEQQADFISCVAWSKQAENAAKYVSKGMQIGVEGRIQTSAYDDETGNRRYLTEVVVNKVTFLESKRNGMPEPQEPAYLSQTTQENVNTTNPYDPGYQNPFNPSFNDPGFNPGVNYNSPFATATTKAGQVQNGPVVNINDDDLPF